MLELLGKPVYRFEDVEVDAPRGCIKRGGQEVHLRQQTLQVLLYLLERRERLVTKEELFEHIWQGAAVTDNALLQCIFDIRKLLGDDSRHPRFIKTFSKVGYRFIGPVEESYPEHSTTIEIDEITAVQIEFDPEAAGATKWHGTNAETLRHAIAETRKQNVLAPVPVSQRLRVALACAGVLILLAAGFLALRFSQKRRDRQLAAVTLPQVPGKKALVVMYFDNRSGSAELDWLRAGLADMLITDLSRSKNLTVLSRQQLYQIMERIGHQPAEAVRLDEALDIARRSRAQAFVLGSFAELGKELRIDMQLHDARDGQLLGTEHVVVDRSGQILTQIDLLSLKLASHLGVTPTQQDATTGLTDVMTNNLAAYRYYSLALEKAQALHNEEAIALLEKAVALDPQFAMAYGRIGYAYAVTGNEAEKAKPLLEKAFQLSNRLTEKDRLYITAWYSIANLDYPGATVPLRKIIVQYPMEVEAYLSLGYLLRGEGQHEEAISVLKQSLVIDPEAKDVYNALGLIYLDLHRYDEAIAAHQRYVQLAPAEPNAYDSLGMSYQCAGRYEEALAAYGQALALRPDNYVANIHLGNAYVQLGRYQAGLAQFRRLVQIAPDDFYRSRAYGSIAETYLRKGNIRQAAAAARMELRFEKYNLWNSVVVALEQGNNAAVNKMEGPLFDDWPYTVRGHRFPPRFNHYRRGYLALRRGQSAKSIEHFKETLRHPPVIWMIDPLEDCLANAYLETGHLDEAISEYERILRLNQNYPLANYHLAQAYERKGQQDQALTAYERFLQTWKDADADLPEVINAHQRLAR
jgi:tetratricopeptide (TPR) repeat protein/DNA-binding winged helix-turn-helix (wHTH) protein